MELNNTELIPRHVAIIMDGNRRWAKKNGLPVVAGHREGYKVFTKMMEVFFNRGVETMTVYAFSTENWQRSETEISAIMELLRYAIAKGGNRMIEEKLRFRLIGRKQDLTEDLRESIEILEKQTEKNTRGNINIAFSYGGRSEIIDAVNEALKGGNSSVSAEDIEKNLYTKGQIDPELIIRTGGQYRLSNFLTWQSVYSELYFTDTLWPDFNTAELDKAFDFFANTKRNFGK